MTRVLSAIRGSFLLRRLHSASGFVPIGLYTFFHLNANGSVVLGELFFRLGLSNKNGVETYQHEVDFIHSIPALVQIELFGIWLPILFHAVLGVVYALGGQSNTKQYSHRANWAYRYQRLTGYWGFLFLLHHVLTLRLGWTWIPLGVAFDAQQAAETTAAAVRGGSDTVLSIKGALAGLLYLSGTAALVFHFANGIRTAAITWGITITVQSQHRFGVVCGIFGFLLLFLGWSGYFGLIVFAK
jgi:succinate dehydrogenase / fumarate reductase cytochrome b subunit